MGLQVLIAVMPADVGLAHALRDRLCCAVGLGDGGETLIQSAEISGSDL